MAPASRRIAARRASPHQHAQPESKGHHPEVSEVSLDECPSREGVRWLNPAVGARADEVHVPGKRGWRLQFPRAVRSRQLETAVEGGCFPRDENRLPVRHERPLPAQPASLYHLERMPVGNEASSFAEATETDLSRVSVPIETIVPRTNTGWNAADHFSVSCSPELRLATTPMESGVSTRTRSRKFLRDHGIVIPRGIRHSDGGFG
jgi:hypothetical protein